MNSARLEGIYHVKRWRGTYGEASCVEDIEQTTDVCYCPAIIVSLDDFDWSTGDYSGGCAMDYGNYHEEG